MGSARRAALVFCVHPTLPFSLADCEYFKAAYGRPIGSKDVPIAIMQLQQRVLQLMRAKLAGAQVALALVQAPL